MTNTIFFFFGLENKLKLRTKRRCNQLVMQDKTKLKHQSQIKLQLKKNLKKTNKSICALKIEQNKK